MSESVKLSFLSSESGAHHGKSGAQGSKTGFPGGRARDYINLHFSGNLVIDEMHKVNIIILPISMTCYSMLLINDAP